MKYKYSMVVGSFRGPPTVCEIEFNVRSFRVYVSACVFSCTSTAVQDAES